MIVVDASAMIDLLLGNDASELEERIVAAGSLHAPHLLDLEVAHGLRRHALAGAADEASVALVDYADLPIERHTQEPLLFRIWELRTSLTAYDAAYVALAELLDAPLITRDAKLARSHGHGARIELV